MKRAGPAAIAVLLVSLVGCYSNTIEPSPPLNPSASATARTTASPTPPPTFEPIGPLVPPIVDANELLYYCHTIAFPPSAIVGPGADELVNHPAAAALRTFLAGEYNTGSIFPAHGWHFLGESLETAEFGQMVADPIEPSGSARYVRFSRSGPLYELGGWGDCWPRLAAPSGLFTLEWWLPGLALPGPAATTIAVNAVALGCAGGPAAGLIEPPNLAVDATWVAIALTGRRIEHQTGCEKGGCGVIVPTSLDVALPEAIGHRSLLDASSWPARDATTEPISLRGCGG